MPPTSHPPPATDAAIQKRGRTTDDNGNAMLESFLSKLFKKEIGGRYSRSAAVVKTGKQVVFVILFVHAAARGCTWTLTLKIVNTLIKNSSRDDWPRISTWNQPTATTPVVSGMASEC